MRLQPIGLFARTLSVFLVGVFLLAGCGPLGTGSKTTQPAQGTVTQPLPSQTPGATITPPALSGSSETPKPTVPAGSTPEATQALSPTQPGTSTSTPVAKPASAQSFPDPAGYAWKLVVSGFPRPVDLKFTPDGTGRMFVVEKRGVIFIVKNGKMNSDMFLNITDRVNSSGNEQGLLGLAFHPQYAKNGFFFINYIDAGGNTVIARYHVPPDHPDTADIASETILLHVTQPYANHNGGSMVFGPDGYLYMGLGDGGSAGDPHSNGQSVETLLGKILRIDVNSPGSGSTPYGIPADNPFASGGGKPEIWAWGLRNPWRFSFDQANGDLYIADVGQDHWEEIDYLPSGSPGGTNFGWNFMEGKHAFRGTPPSGVTFTDPVMEYGHDQGCSVTGGYVYRGLTLPEFQGIYLYADYCSGTLWGLLKDSAGNWQSKALFQTGMNITSFGQDPAGEVYAVDEMSGGIYLLQRK